MTNCGGGSVAFVLLFGILKTLATAATTRETPQGCIVNQTHVLCEHSPRDALPLRQLRDARSLRNVHSIIVHNAFIDFTSDIFNFEDSLPSVSLLDAKSNKVDRIGRRGFDKLHNVEFLYLSHNQITHVQHDPFLSLQKLQLLEMNEAFGDIDASAKESALTTLFSSQNSFKNLIDIQLNNNNIQLIDKDTFCNVKGLKRLELSENEIENFDFVSACLSALEALDVSGNKITTVSDEVWESLPSLSSLDVSGNPLHCDCQLVKLAKDEKIRFLNQGKTFCATPAKYANKSVFDIGDEICTTSGGSSFVHFLFLTIIAACVLFAYRRYRRKPAAVGYEHIEREVSPQFV